MWRWSLQKPVPIGANSLGRRQSRRLLVLPGRSASREYGLEADVGFGHFRGGFENRIQVGTGEMKSFFYLWGRTPLDLDRP